MSQACEKCCGKLIPGPHQLAGVCITCAAGKPHSAPPLSFGGWCLRLWVRSIPPPWIYNAHSMICALLSPDSLPPVGSSLYSASHAVLRRNHWGGAFRSDTYRTALPPHIVSWQRPFWPLRMRNGRECARSPVRPNQVMHVLHTWLGRVLKAASNSLVPRHYPLWRSDAWTSHLYNTIVW